MKLIERGIGAIVYEGKCCHCEAKWEAIESELRYVSSNYYSRCNECGGGNSVEYKRTERRIHIQKENTANFSEPKTYVIHNNVYATATIERKATIADTY